MLLIFTFYNKRAFCNYQFCFCNKCDGSLATLLRQTKLYQSMCKRMNKKAVRVKGGKSLRNGMWHGVRNGIIMRNTIYAGNKLTELNFRANFIRAAAFLMLRTLAKY